MGTNSITQQIISLPRFVQHFRESSMDIRKWKWPLWYYGLILLTVLSTGFGVYYKGAMVQGDLETPRVAMGLILTALCGLAAWAFRSLLQEIRRFGGRVDLLAEAMFVILIRESRNHPEDAEVAELLREMVSDRTRGRLPRSYGDD